MDSYIKQIPTQGDLEKHTKAMDEMLQKIQEVGTGLKTDMKQYKISE
jgi:hypothetical protein